MSWKLRAFSLSLSLPRNIHANSSLLRLYLFTVLSPRFRLFAVVLFATYWKAFFDRLRDHSRRGIADLAELRRLSRWKSLSLSLFSEVFFFERARPPRPPLAKLYLTAPEFSRSKEFVSYVERFFKRHENSTRGGGKKKRNTNVNTSASVFEFLPRFVVVIGFFSGGLNRTL